VHELISYSADAFLSKAIYSSLSTVKARSHPIMKTIMINIVLKIVLNIKEGNT